MAQFLDNEEHNDSPEENSFDKSYLSDPKNDDFDGESEIDDLLAAQVLW